MVSATWGGLVTLAAVLMSSQLVTRADAPSYSLNALDSVKALQNWYDSPTGLWNSTGWWNGGNCLTVVADWAMHDSPNAESLGVAGIMANTFTNAQKTPPKLRKRTSGNDLVTSIYNFQTRQRRDNLVEGNTGFPGFLNDFYDDEGWWALGWIRSWDVTHEQKYLDMAQSIFEDMRNGTDSVCGGGIWWKKDRKYKNAIANELYLSVAASLANRVTDRKDDYLSIALGEWEWFKASGMINGGNLINDGLTINADGSCFNNNSSTWTYNQGVILGGLVELSKATNNNTSYLDEATNIAKAALLRLCDSLGILHEVDRCEPNCGDDGSQFKGIFMRNLNYLHAVAPQDVFRTAIMANADSIWKNNRNENNQLGISWLGPPNAGGGPNASTHSSAMDAIVAAMAIVS